MSEGKKSMAHNQQCVCSNKLGLFPFRKATALGQLYKFIFILFFLFFFGIASG